MNKGQFSDNISRIVKKYPCKVKVLGGDREFILEACRSTPRYNKLATEDDVIVKLSWKVIGNGRKVKMIHLQRNGTGFSIPVSKRVLVEANYPTKKRESKVSSEKKHRSAVLSSMRNMVRDQMKEYRKMVTYPLTCWRSGERIIKGMKTDVDHVGRPFLQIADAFLIENHLKYSDIALAGGVNDKRFKDSDLERSWKKFHKERATLALVLSKENRSAGCGEYSSPEGLLGSFSKEGAISLDF